MVNIDIPQQSEFDADFVIITEFIYYDDACHLKKYAQNSVCRNITWAAQKMAEMEMIVDCFHFKNHVDRWCKEQHRQVSSREQVVTWKRSCSKERYSDVIIVSVLLSDRKTLFVKVKHLIPHWFISDANNVPFLWMAHHKYVVFTVHAISELRQMRYQVCYNNQSNQ